MLVGQITRATSQLCRRQAMTTSRAHYLVPTFPCQLNTPAEAAELLVLRDALSNKNRPVRDVNGFRKMLLALTATGEAVGMDGEARKADFVRSTQNGVPPLEESHWSGGRRGGP